MRAANLLNLRVHCCTNLPFPISRYECCSCLSMNSSKQLQDIVSALHTPTLAPCVIYFMQSCSHR